MTDSNDETSNNNRQTAQQIEDDLVTDSVNIIESISNVDEDPHSNDANVAANKMQNNVNEIQMEHDIEMADIFEHDLMTDSNDETSNNNRQTAQQIEDDLVTDSVNIIESISNVDEDSANKMQNNVNEIQMEHDIEMADIFEHDLMTD
eukprot:264050_1